MVELHWLKFCAQVTSNPSPHPAPAVTDRWPIWIVPPLQSRGVGPALAVQPPLSVLTAGTDGAAWRVSNPHVRTMTSRGGATAPALDLREQGHIVPESPCEGHKLRALRDANTYSSGLPSGGVHAPGVGMHPGKRADAVRDSVVRYRRGRDRERLHRARPMEAPEASTRPPSIPVYAAYPHSGMHDRVAQGGPGEVPLWPEQSVLFR